MTAKTDRQESAIDQSAAAANDSQRIAKRRSIAIAVMLALMVVLFYAATIVRLGGNVINKTW